MLQLLVVERENFASPISRERSRHAETLPPTLQVQRFMAKSVPARKLSLDGAVAFCHCRFFGANSTWLTNVPKCPSLTPTLSSLWTRSENAS
ncbi:hypothetical protein PILCRDRAFT_542517 [Piloderma croceum F 1598]|uniref:Uncharacterized protein n=1 Tax=Piloderma croceum (strain F 1598) TaxID=765440 RepID=A0A0C3BRS4_PILCF|nr:hypothetical protein PILCRDRAFT_542517 [Piloderma croceum F 1598]